MAEIAERDKQIAFSTGFLEKWCEKELPEVKSHVEILVGGVSFYKELCETIQLDLDKLQKLYTDLTVQSAQYLKFANQQKALLDQHLGEGGESLQFRLPRINPE